MRRFFVATHSENEALALEAVADLLRLAAPGVEVVRGGSGFAEIHIDPSDWSADEIVNAMRAWRSIRRIQLSGLSRELLSLDLRPVLRDVAEQSKAAHGTAREAIRRASSGIGKR